VSSQKDVPKEANIISMSINTTPTPLPVIKTISKESVHRLMHDVRHIIKNPLVDNGIYYQHDDEDMLKGYALIVGPSETPYFGGFYFFEFFFPVDYPHTPPKVLFRTQGEGIRFNPNLYTCGKVCISLLNTWKGEQWTSCQSLTTILLTLCTLLNNDPLLNEPGVTRFHQDREKYNQIIAYKNIDIAILQVLEKPDPAFECFYEICLERLIANKDALLAWLKEKESMPLVKLQTQFYRMNVSMNYGVLLRKFTKMLDERGIEYAKDPEPEPKTETKTKRVRKKAINSTLDKN
jgi:ubiquitin-protein ligase